jgi:hypothetical protein
VKFLADAMLGRLARWLRAVGCDVAQLPIETPDPALVEFARREDRILLTRDGHLLRELRPDRAVRILSDVPLEQLREVVVACGIARPREPFTRCLVCNEPLVDAPLEEVSDRVPTGARNVPGPLRRCPVCERVYWRGSHARRMEAALATAFVD